MPLQWKGWSARPELTLRDTLYTQRQIFTMQPDGTLASSAEDNALNRKALEMSFELRPPALSRVFNIHGRDESGNTLSSRECAMTMSRA